MSKVPTTVWAVIVLSLVVIGLAVGLFFVVRKMNGLQNERELITGLLNEQLETLRNANEDIKGRVEAEIRGLELRKQQLEAELKVLTGSYQEKKAAIAAATTWDDLVGGTK